MSAELLNWKRKRPNYCEMQLVKEEKIVKTKITKPEGGFEISADITLSNYKKMRIQRSEDRNKFQ